MSLEAILEAVRASGEAQIREIEARAQAQVREILAGAKAGAQRLREESRAVSVGPAAAERARILYRARLEARQIVGDAREALVDAALCQTRECLAGIRTDAAYGETVHQLTKEALVELNGSLQGSRNTRLEADPRDRELIDGVLPDLSLELPTSYELDCWGGLIAKSGDGRVVVINTLEARLERATPYLRRYLAALFEEGQSTEDAEKDEGRTERCPAMTMAMHAYGR